MAVKIAESQAKALFLRNKLEPLEPFPGTQKPWKSKCLITGKTVSPTYGKVRDFGHRCKYCSGFEIDIPGAIALMKSRGFSPLDKYPGANRPWKCKCQTCKKITSPTYSNVSKGIGCKYCSKRAVDPNDAAVAMKKRGFKTLEPFPGATIGWSVQCLKCKKKYKTHFHSLNTLKRCKYCAGVSVEVDDLLNRLKELKLKPLEAYQSAKVPWKCRCLVCNHVVQPTWSRIKQGRGHCAYCSQRRVDLPMATKFMKSIDLKPLVEFPGGNKPWLCRCLKCKVIAFPLSTTLASVSVGYCGRLKS